MREFLQRFLRKEPGTAGDAKQRLKLLLIHDQVDLTPAQMESMKDEILAVFARYVEVDTDDMEFRLDRLDGKIALVSNVRVKKVTERFAANG